MVVVGMVSFLFDASNTMNESVHSFDGMSSSMEWFTVIATEWLRLCDDVNTELVPK